MSKPIVSYTFEQVLGYCDNMGRNYNLNYVDGDRYIWVEIGQSMAIIVRPISQDDDTLKIAINGEVLYKGTSYYDIKKILELFEKKVK